MKLMIGLILGLILGVGLTIASASLNLGPLADQPVKDVGLGKEKVEVRKEKAPVPARIYTPLPVTITLPDAKTGQPIRDELFSIQVDLSQFGDKGKSANEFLGMSKANAVTYIKTLTTKYEKPIVEEISSDFTVTLNVGVRLNDVTGKVSWKDRVRLYLDGTKYATLDPNVVTLEGYLENLKTNVLAAYGG